MNMIKFKYKAQGEESEVLYFSTFQEVADYIKLLCEADTLQDVLNCQKEYNIRFYISIVNK